MSSFPGFLPPNFQSSTWKTPSVASFPLLQANWRGKVRRRMLLRPQFGPGWFVFWSCSIPESKHRYQKISIFKRNHLFQTVFLGCPCSSHVYQWDEEVTKWTINAFLNFLCWLSSYIAMLAVSLWNFLRFENMDTFQAVTSQRTAWLFPPLKQCIVLCTCMAPFFSLGRAAFFWTWWNESFL